MDKEKIINEIKEKGYHIIENYYSEEKCDSIVKEIESSFPKGFVEQPNDLSRGGDWRMIRGQEHYKSATEFLNDTFINEVANEYIGRNYVKKRCQVGVVKPKNGQEICSGGGWHVDNHDPQFKSIIYLTDVEEGNGQFCIVESSTNMIKDLGTYKANANDNSQTRISESNVFESFDDSRIKSITGKKGTMILVDTSNIHRGTNLKWGERITFTNYFYH